VGIHESAQKAVFFDFWQYRVPRHVHFSRTDDSYQNGYVFLMGKATHWIHIRHDPASYRIVAQLQDSTINMCTLNRRQLLHGLAAATVSGAVALPTLAQQRTRRFRMLLNTSVSGPQAWFYVSEDKGYLAAEGIEITFTPGGGAYTAAPRMHGSDFDFGYGDINSLIEVAAANPGAGPVGVFTMFNASPSTIVVSADGPVRAPKDLEGKTIVGHSNDVALKTFGAFCKSAGVDRSKVKVEPFGGGFRSQVEAMLGSRTVHGVFGYVSTIASAMAEGGPDNNRRLRHLRFADHAPDLYGSTFMASRRLLSEDRNAIAAVVRAFNRGLADVVRDPEAGIDAVMRRAAYADRDAEMLRLKTTLGIEMAHAEGKRLGIGAVDNARLQRSIDLIAATNDLQHSPPMADVFLSDFLPPLEQRIRNLAR
jgi:NitT/TauT family transport system substrate-binding protein